MTNLIWLLAGNGPTSPSTAPVGSPSDSSAESPQESISPSASDFPSGIYAALWS